MPPTLHLPERSVEPKRPRRDGRPHVAPPPPVAPDWRRELDAACAVDEVLGAALFPALRAVRLWASLPRKRRSEAFIEPTERVRARFTEAVAAAPELTEVLGLFSFLAAAPEAVEGRAVAEACHRVHRWADERSLLPLATWFAEAAALAEPEDAERANLAARTCRRSALHHRAAAWYQRAFKLAVHGNEPDDQVGALLGYGAVMKELGLYKEAKKYFERGASRALHFGRKRKAAEAHHDLLTIAAETGTYKAAERHLLLALQNYPYSHPAVPTLAHDWAFLLVRLNYHLAALPLLREITSIATLITPKELQLLYWGTFARAAAGSGAYELFETGKQQVLALTPSCEPYAPAALVNVAEGACIRHQWIEAAEFATKASRIATARQDSGPEVASREVLQRAVGRVLADLEPRGHLSEDRLASLSRRLTDRLRRWKAANKIR